MAKIYYYKVKIKKNSRTMNNSKIKKLIQSKIMYIPLCDKGCEQNIIMLNKTKGEYSSITPLKQTDDFIIFKVGKENNSNQIDKVEDSTGISETVFDTNDLTKKHIEITTAIYYNYDTGILSILNKLSAPSAKIFSDFLLELDSSLDIKLVQIPHKDKIKGLMENGSKLKSIEYLIQNIDIKVLEDFTKLKKKDIEYLMDGDELQLQFSIVAKPNKYLSTDSKKHKNIISELLSSRTVTPSRITGSLPNSQTELFKLDEDAFFGHNINIKNYFIQDHKKIEYTTDKLYSIICKEIVKSYNNHITELTTFYRDL